MINIFFRSYDYTSQKLLCSDFSCVHKLDYKWKSLVSGQYNNVKTPIADGMFSLTSMFDGLPDFELPKQNQKECAGSRSGNSNAVNSNYFFLF